MVSIVLVCSFVCVRVSLLVGLCVSSFARVSTDQNLAPYWGAKNSIVYWVCASASGCAQECVFDWSLICCCLFGWLFGCLAGWLDF